VDAEVITMATHFLYELGIAPLQLEINSVGCKKCRSIYNEKLIAYLSSKKDMLCKNCVDRLSRNPLRILDCKNDNCKLALKGAPKFSSFWCDECREHFESVLKSLDEMETNYVVNEQIVRGLDYYTRTAFEFITNDLGSQNAVLGGGRYDGLVEELGGPKIGGVGFALGVERLILLLEKAGYSDKPSDVIYFAALGNGAKKSAQGAIQNLRKNGFKVVWDYGEKSLKAQMRRAGKINAKIVIIMGDDEFKSGKVVVKNMDKGEQTNVALNTLSSYLANLGG